MTIPSIAVDLVAPNSVTGANTFNDDANAWAGDIITWTEQVNLMTTAMNETAAEVDADKVSSGNSATAAGNSATAANTSAGLAAGSANYKGLWSAQTGAANKPYSVSHSGSFWALNNNLANVTTSIPSLTNPDWQFISGTRWQGVVTTSGSLAANAMHQILATSGAVDRQLPASMSVSDFIVVANSVQSTQTVRVTNNGYTIYSKLQTLTSSDNIVLEAGSSVSLRCTASNTLEVYNG